MYGVIYIYIEDCKEEKKDIYIIYSKVFLLKNTPLYIYIISFNIKHQKGCQVSMAIYNVKRLIFLREKSHMFLKIAFQRFYTDIYYFSSLLWLVVNKTSLFLSL